MQSPSQIAMLVRIAYGLAQVLAWLVAAALVWLLSVLAYRTTLHPLASVPGPKLAAVSNIWYAYHAKNGRLAQLGRSLHQRYGPAVRVGPNELWFNSKAAFKAIYGTGNSYEKSDFYLATVLQRPRIDWFLQAHPADTLDLLSERDMKRYRLQRRLIGPVYRPANVVRYEQEVDAVLDRAVARLKSLDGDEIELKEWMHIVVVECLGAVVLSWSPGMLKQGTDWGTSAHSYQAWRRKTVLGLFPIMAKLEMCSKPLGRAFSLIWGLVFKPPPNFRAFFPDAGRRIARRLKFARRAKDDRRDLAADLIRVHHEKTDFTETYLRKMIMTNFGAGHETLASTLTSVMTMIGSHGHVQRRLRDEVLQTSESRSYADAVKMPYMQSVIKESKRLHPVISTALPRRVPPSGLHLHGHFIPGSTTVGCNPVALHRNEEVCGPRPHAFDPERWSYDADRARDMEAFSLSWGGGTRTCPGRHLAEMIVWKVVEALVRELDVQVKIPEDEMPTYFLSMMTGVRARFHPRGTTQITE